MNSFERYFGDTYELVDVLKNSERDFVAAVYDKRAKRLCMMKRRELNSLPIYKLLKELDNPHVPQIYRLFERDGKLIVVEEHIDGQTLEDFLTYRPNELDEEFVEKILLQLCDCLDAFHARQIIHRDLKPSNIMLTEKNFVKVIDFGIARIFKPNNSADTEILGTRGYAPPEQYGLFELGQTDPRSDIYSLGVTMKKLLGNDCGGRLKKILDKCTAQAPAQRFQSASELRIAVLSRKKFWLARKIFVAALTGFAIIFLPQVVDFKTSKPEEIPAPEVKISKPEEIPAPEVKTSKPEKTFDEKIFESSAIQIPPLPQSDLPEINITPPAPRTEIKPSPAQSEEKISGEVELKIFLNGELTGEDGRINLYDCQNWSRSKRGDYFFPDDWNAHLRVENNSGKTLINPKIKVHVGYEEFFFDAPNILSGQTFDLDIPLAGKVASPPHGLGNLQITIQPEGESPIYRRKTFRVID